MIENRRSIERKSLNVHVNIVDMQTQQPMGAVVNIHQEGLLLVGPQSLEADRIYQLQLNPTGEADSVGAIDVGVDCVWSTGNDDSCWAGCRIIDASTQAQQRIETLNQQFSVDA